MYVDSNARSLFRLILAIGFCAFGHAQEPTTLNFSVNGLSISVDRHTGSLLRLDYPATGVILDAPPQKAGLLDLAYPIDSFVPMRLASRFSRTKVTKEGNGGVIITWDSLGPSRDNFALPRGNVYAQE